MEWSEVLNIVLGGGLVGTVIGLASLRSALKKARGEAEKAVAEADTVKITNTETATRILIENIVNPLKEELHETRKELGSVKRVVARLQKAIDGANNCRYSAGCPVLERMRLPSPDGEGGCDPVATDGAVRAAGRTRDSPRGRQRKRGDGQVDGGGDGSGVDGESDDSGGQPP